MPIIVGVQFKRAGKLYYFDPLDVSFEVGEAAIVETVRGIEYGIVSVANREVSDSEIVGQLKPIIRKATAEDIKRQETNTAKAVGVVAQAQEKADKRKLNMKILDAEYTFDNSKLVFYFTADGRVDFRELVKDLASVFHIRIDLRQIGIRDECKFLGGLGPCGRACCCSNHLGDFEKVSIKMAKTQGLSLNPTKISGLCGRLMCCLKYENEHYTETSKIMPALDSFITTPDGRAKVISCDLLRQTVTAGIKNKMGDIEVHTYTLDVIKAEKVLAESVDDSVTDPELKKTID